MWSTMGSVVLVTLFLVMLMLVDPPPLLCNPFFANLFDSNPDSDGPSGANNVPMSCTNRCDVYVVIRVFFFAGNACNKKIV